MAATTAIPYQRSSGAQPTLRRHSLHQAIATHGSNHQVILSTTKGKGSGSNGAANDNVQVTRITGGHKRIPSDPLDESIYNLVLRPGEEDRPPPLYRSKYASQVRAAHVAARRQTGEGRAPKSGSRKSAGSSESVSGGLVSSPTDSVTGGNRKPLQLSRLSPSKQRNPRAASSATEESASRNEASQRKAGQLATQRALIKPASGRIALAAERRSNATTPVVADPSMEPNMDDTATATAYGEEHLMDDSASADELVPEELLAHLSIADDPTAIHHRQEDMNGGRPTEMLSSLTTNSGKFDTNRGKAGRATVAGAKFKEKVHTKGAGSAPQPLTSSSSVSGAGGQSRRMLPEGERMVILAGLKANHQSLLGQYNRLPVTTDTAGKINRKISIENQLKLLEDDIRRFSHPNIIIQQ
ncbi:hypothetical protein DFJ73DRAFT_916870 [Zopfochytrium polystomum]|nr:hypothetical protein DFJ73DRAFT_916870 [Zopfochytrium polystomum]